jgi:hypothetical protein
LGVFEMRHTTRVLLFAASTDHTFIDARRRTTWGYPTGRGRKVDLELENRRRLLTDRERPRPAARSTMWTALLVHDRSRHPRYGRPPARLGTVPETALFIEAGLTTGCTEASSGSSRDVGRR